MSTLPKYKIIRGSGYSSNIESFKKEINDNIDKGYYPLGGISTAGDNSLEYFFQPMILKSEMIGTSTCPMVCQNMTGQGGGSSSKKENKNTTKKIKVPEKKSSKKTIKKV